MTTKTISDIITKLRAGRDPDTGELHITEAEAVEAIEAREAEARIDQTELLQRAEDKFGKVDWEAAIYELKDRKRFA